MVSKNSYYLLLEKYALFLQIKIHDFWGAKKTLSLQPESYSIADSYSQVTHTHTHARTHACTHTHTQKAIMQCTVHVH